MKYNELDELITKLYPLQPYELILDQSCITSITFRLVEGSKKSAVNVVYYKVLVSMKNMPSFYMEIEEHSTIMTCNEALSHLTSSDIYIQGNDLQALRDADVKKNLNRADNGRDEILKRIMDYSGKSEAEILKLAGLPS